MSPAIFEYWFKKYNVNAKYNYKEIKEENVVVFKFDNLSSPLDVFESPDARKLGILLKSVKIIEN